MPQIVSLATAALLLLALPAAFVGPGRPLSLRFAASFLAHVGLAALPACLLAEAVPGLGAEAAAGVTACGVALALLATAPLRKVVTVRVARR